MLVAENFKMIWQCHSARRQFRAIDVYAESRSLAARNQTAACSRDDGTGEWCDGLVAESADGRSTTPSDKPWSDVKPCRQTWAKPPDS